MHLLSSAAKKIEEFPDREAPSYAILSHTWGEDEVLFDDLNDFAVSNKLGCAKIMHCCSQAELDGFSHVWVDTCCIDKKTSAEMSYAINSMFNWYRETQVCYVYLSDVPSDEDPLPENSAFARSRWFTRGWTLQELLAPRQVVFYAKNGIKIGTKSSLQDRLSAITGVSADFLLGTYKGVISVARKMSWA